MKKIQSLLIKHKIFIFPAILLVLLIGMTAFRISGTSSGMYYQYLYGDATKDPNLLFGRPQPVRSDEWLVNTPITIAQADENFPRINHNFLDGKDMSVTFDVPYRDWSAFFKPQNVSFFVLPLEFALAFKWWVMLFTLMVSAYFFTLRLLPKKIPIAIFASIIISCSPFVFWWYQTNIMAYGFLIMLASMSIIDRTTFRIFKKKIDIIPSTAIKVILLTYLLICFALTLYPPFQIPVVIVVASFLLGYMIRQLAQQPKKRIIKVIIAFMAALVLTGATCGLYIATRSDAVKTIANTAYPGKRVVLPGGYSIKKLLVTYLQPELQSRTHGPHYDNNQSESSNFIVLPFFFVVPALVLLVWVYRTRKKIEWTLVTLLGCLVIFSLHMFVPQATFVTKLFLLYYVPQSRLIIGFGFLAIVLLVDMLRIAAEYKLTLTKRNILALAGYSFAFFLLIVWAGLETAKIYPDFVSSRKIILSLAAIVTVGQFFVIINKLRTGLFILAAFSIGSIVLVNPLYVGLGPLYNSPVTKEINSLSTKNDTWAAAGNIVIENLPQMSDRHAITGVSGYPSINFWKTNTGPSNESIYNRYAHIFVNVGGIAPLTLLGPDLFVVTDTCTNKINTTLDYIVSVAPLNDSCYQLHDTIKYPAMNFYFYHVKHQ